MSRRISDIGVTLAITGCLLLQVFHPVLAAPADIVGVLDPGEDVAIKQMREEEKLARDVYIFLYKKWGMTVFNNISSAEQNHMNAVLNLITSWGLADPASKTVGVFNNPVLQQLYYDLTTQGKRSKVDAVLVGGYIEELDILDLWNCLDNSDDNNITTVFTNLVNGSYNHLNAYSAQYTRLTGKSYVPQLLTIDEYNAIVNNSTGGGGGGGGWRWGQ